MTEEVIANQNTTDLHVPQTMDITPKVIEPDDGESFDPRKDIMAEIVKNRQKILENESNVTAQQIAEHEEVSAPKQEEYLSSKPEEVVADPVVDKAGSSSAPATVEKYTIVVDGQPIEYTIDELRTQAQLGLGARKRFEEAAELRRQAEALMYAAPRQYSQPESAMNQDTQMQSDIPETELRDIAKRMNYGSEEEQVKALKDAGILFNKNAARPSGPTPQEVIAIATQNAIATLDVRQEQAILANEFKDIIADPALAVATDVIATQLFNKYQALGQSKTRMELLREAGQTAKDKYLRTPPSSPEQKSTVPMQAVAPMQEKLERKRTAPQPPSAASKIASEPTKDSRYSPSSVVAQMRKARGQGAF